jgi:hypothetical protein
MATEKINVWFRTKARVIFIIICVVIMIVWFVPVGRLLQARPVAKGEIYGEKVSSDQVQGLARILLFMTGRQDAQAQQLAMAQAWEAMILNKEAERYGVVATDEDVRTALLSRFGSEQGVLDMASYQSFLQEIQTPRPEFEASLKVFATANKLLTVVRDSMLMPDEDAWLWYARDNQQAKAAFLEMRAVDFAPLVSFNDEELRAFHQQYAEQDPKMDMNGIGYLEPERVKIEYALLPYDSVKVEATDEEVRQYYEDHKADYKLPKAADAAADAPDEYTPPADVAAAIKEKLSFEAAKKAVAEKMNAVNEEIWARLDVPFGSEEVRTIDLADIADQFGLEHVTTDFFTSDQVGTVLPGAETLINRAFGQGIGGIRRPSAPLSADRGMFVFQIIEDRPPRPAPFDEVKLQVAKDYQIEKGLDLAMEVAAKASEAKSLDAAAETVKTEIAALLKPGTAEAAKTPEQFFTRGVSQFFSRSSEIYGNRYQYHTGLPGNHNYARFADTAFALNEGEVSMVVEPVDARAVFLLERAGTKPADRAAFDKDKENIVRRLSRMKAEADLRTWLAEVRRRARPSKEVTEFIQLLPQWAVAEN